LCVELKGLPLNKWSTIGIVVAVYQSDPELFGASHLSLPQVLSDSIEVFLEGVFFNEVTRLLMIVGDLGVNRALTQVTGSESKLASRGKQKLMIEIDFICLENASSSLDIHQRSHSSFVCHQTLVSLEGKPRHCPTPGVSSTTLCSGLVQGSISVRLHTHLRLEFVKMLEPEPP